MNYSNNLFKHNHGRVISKLEKFLENNEEFVVKEIIIDPDIKNHRVGYIVYNKLMQQNLFIGAKSYMYNLSSINDFVYEKCKNNDWNFAIFYLAASRYAAFPDKKPRLYVFDIKEIQKDSGTKLNIRYGYRQQSTMINFKTKLASNYDKLKESKFVKG